MGALKPASGTEAIGQDQTSPKPLPVPKAVDIHTSHHPALSCATTFLSSRFR